MTLSPAPLVHHERREEEDPFIESIKRVTGQRSSGIVLDYVAAATIDEDPPLLLNVREQVEVKTRFGL